MANGTGRRNLKKEAFWRRAVAGQSRSGLSVKAWCRKQGLSESSFYWWRRELARRTAQTGQAAFVPIRVTEEGPGRADQQIEIVLTDGRCVRVTGSVDRQALADVLDVLERRAC